MPDPLYRPGFGTLDFSIFKNTPITERISTQFRVEIFNLFNRLNLGGPSNDVAGGSGNGLIYGRGTGEMRPASATASHATCSLR